MWKRSHLSVTPNPERPTTMMQRTCERNKIRWLLFYNSSSTAIDPFCAPFVLLAGSLFDLAIDASLSIICLDTETMLSSISCWPTSSRSVQMSVCVDPMV